MEGETAALLLQKAECLNGCGRRSDALTCADKARQYRESPRLVPVSLAFSTRIWGWTCGCADDVRARRSPGTRARAAHLFNRATVRRFLGDLSGAEVDFDRVISLDSKDYEAYFNRSDLRTQSTARNHTVEMEKLLASGIDRWDGQVQIHYALGKEYEDLGAHPKAFQHFEAGASLRRRHLRYDVQQDINIIQRIIRTYSLDAVGSA